MDLVTPPLFSGDRPEKNRVESNDVIRGLFWPAAGAEKNHTFGVFSGGGTLQNSYFFFAPAARSRPQMTSFGISPDLDPQETPPLVLPGFWPEGGGFPGPYLLIGPQSRGLGRLPAP